MSCSKRIVPLMLALCLAFIVTAWGSATPSTSAGPYGPSSANGPTQASTANSAGVVINLAMATVKGRSTAILTVLSTYAFLLMSFPHSEAFWGSFILILREKSPKDRLSSPLSRKNLVNVLS
jgi:hypothetical protein